jgi:Fe-S cluster assembly protein SufB
MAEKRSQVKDIDRSIYDFRYDEEGFYKVDEGLTEDIVKQISKEKNDPEWMTEFRLKSLEIYNKLEVPEWGPDISGLNMNDIVTYVRPNTNMKAKWLDTDWKSYR